MKIRLFPCQSAFYSSLLHKLAEQTLRIRCGIDAEVGSEEFLHFGVVFFDAGALALCGVDFHYQAVNVFAVRIDGERFVGKFLADARRFSPISSFARALVTRANCSM